MNFKVTKAMIHAAACLCLLVGTTGCNVDRLWPDRQSPGGMNSAATKANTRHSSDDAVDIAIVEAQEVDLIEAVVSHRSLYHRNLEQLRRYYDQHGYATKEQWAAFELAGLKDVASCQYLMDAEIPSDELRPTDRVEQADSLYKQGLDLMKRGGHGVPGLYRQNHMIQAAKLFKQLIELYPTSDKIDDAAFYCGEIHKEYLPGKETIAVRWYERAWTWNPQTDHPARFQAAVVHDYRLHDRDRALELYHGVIDHETANKSNVRFASRRIHELTANTGASHAVSP